MDSHHTDPAPHTDYTTLPQRSERDQSATKIAFGKETSNLADAMVISDIRRRIAQNIAWVYALGSEPYRETDPLDIHSEGKRAIAVRDIKALEQLALNTPPIGGVVLRHGHVYGPGAEGPGNDLAAHAALLAIDKHAPGIFNLAEQTCYAANDMARQEPGWNPGFRLQ